MSQLKQQIFLSYAHEDIGMAKKIYNDLKRYELDVWIDYKNILPGQNWKVAIEKVIKQSTYYVVLLSSHTMSERGFVQKELKVAFEILEQCSEVDIYIIPVRLNECEPSLKGSDIYYIDLFPESEYRTGLKKILQVVSPKTFSLRNEPITLSQADVNGTIRLHDFFDKYLNPESRGFNHQYKELTIKGDNVIVDEATKLVWQQSGSPKEMIFKNAKEWVRELNKTSYAGYKDWRLPTLEEAMSLMEPTQKNAYLFIDPVFDSEQTWIWTADQVKDQSLAWAVHFLFGRCNISPFDVNLFVRAVRLVQSTKAD